LCASIFTIIIVSLLCRRGKSSIAPEQYTTKFRNPLYRDIDV
jgi:hypothetical protein